MASFLSKYGAVGGYGAIGAACMPLITLGQDLIQGSSPNQLASLFAFLGWGTGVFIVAAIGAFVATAVELSQSKQLKALAIGLTLPATVAAIGHERSPSNRTFIASAIAEEAKDQQSTTIGSGASIYVYNPAQCENCSYVFYNKAGSIIGTWSFVGANTTPITIPPNAARASIYTPSGIVPAPIPNTSGSYTLRLEPKSGFTAGLVSAFGIPTTPYRVDLTKGNTP